MTSVKWASPKSPSISNAFLVYCVLPIIILTLTSTFIDNKDPLARVPVENVVVGAGGGNDAIDVKVTTVNSAKGNVKSDRNRSTQPKQEQKQSSSSHRKTKRNENNSESSPARQSNTETKTIDDNIERLRSEYKNDTNDMYKALALADALRERDLVHHDGGKFQQEAISTYQSAIQMLSTKYEAIDASSDDHPISSAPLESEIYGELFVEIHEKSMHGLLVYAYSNLAKQYYMANMFEITVQTYNKALELAPHYLDVLVSRAGALIVLGKYAEAGKDYDRVLELDHQDIFIDAYSNMARVLVAKEDAITNGWNRVESSLVRLIPKLEAELSILVQQSSPSQAQLGSVLNRLKTLHLTYFMYYDHKTQDTDSAWKHLSMGHSYKVSNLAPYDYVREKQQIQNTKQIFTETFWPDHIGIQDRTPIFIIGFPRSGSTLLERILDSHPLIVGTGEDSVFNGMLDQIRNAIVDASLTGSVQILHDVVKEKAHSVLKITRERWKEIDRNTIREHGDANNFTESKSVASKIPKRFTDKMLHNYMNVGFIHLLFPNALILHISRNPMDTLFSAFKHDFPPGNLDYTSEFKALNQMYRGYRDIIDHWDRVLPGRVTHIRYEDMANDMSGIAKAVISAAGLPWDPDVLNFHKKKHAVNTYSTTQVRKSVYTDSIQSWKKYEKRLQPLLEFIGPYAKHRTKTSLKGYKVPSS